MKNVLSYRGFAIRPTRDVRGKLKFQAIGMLRGTPDLEQTKHDDIIKLIDEWWLSDEGKVILDVVTKGLVDLEKRRET